MDGWITTHAPALRRFASAGCKVGAGEDSMKDKAAGSPRGAFRFRRRRDTAAGAFVRPFKRRRRCA
jgi:hypothetical protein